MSGIINSTGAKSGVIGTTVGGTNAANVGSGALPVGVTGGTGLTGHARIGDSTRSFLAASMTNRPAGLTYITGMQSDYIDNAAVYEHHADGIKVLLGGTYLIQWSVYTYSHTNASPVNENYTQEYLTYKNNASPDTLISKSYVIFCRPHDGDGHRYWKMAHSHAIQLNANDVVGMYVNTSAGNNYKVSSGINDTFISMTYLSEHT